MYICKTCKILFACCVCVSGECLDCGLWTMGLILVQKVKFLKLCFFFFVFFVFYIALCSRISYNIISS